MNALRKFKPKTHFYHASPGLLLEVWDGISFEDRWLICAEAFRFVEKRNSKFQIHAFVMMSTHLHLLFSCQNLEEQYVIEEFDRGLLYLVQNHRLEYSKQKAHTCFDHPVGIEAITNYQQLLNTYRYIYRNPIEAGLCVRAEDFPYSTLGEVMGRVKSQMNSMDLLHVIQNPFRILNWLNSSDDIRLFSHSKMM
jgi:REP element-mobilizing transposase RayT